MTTKFGFPRAHKRSVSMLHQNGKRIAFASVDHCKDQLQAKVARQLYPDYANLVGLANGLALSSLKANLERPGFILYTGKDHRERNAGKFLNLIHQVEQTLQLPTLSSTEIPEMPEDCKSGPIIAIADQWWVKSPVNLTAYFTFFRCAPYMKMRESLKRFLERIRTRKNNQEDAKAVVEASYIETAINNGNFSAFMEKALPAQNREGFSDWLLATQTRGIVTYNRAADAKYPMTEKELYELRVTKEVDRARKRAGISWS